MGVVDAPSVARQRSVFAVLARYGGGGRRSARFRAVLFWGPASRRVYGGLGGTVMFVILMMDISRSENNTLVRLLTCNNRFLWWLNIVVPLIAYGLLFGTFLFRTGCATDNDVVYAIV